MRAWRADGGSKWLLGETCYISLSSSSFFHFFFFFFLTVLLLLLLLHSRAGMAQWLERRTRDWKVAGSNPCRSGGRIFFSRVDFLCSYFGIRSTPVLPQWHVKDPGHSAKSAGGRLQLNTHTLYVCGFAWSDMEHGCMVYTGLAPRRLQFHVAPAMPAL